jgi:hypothetical protein
MGTNENAFATLNAEIFIPDGDFARDIALLELCGASRKSSIWRKGANGKGVTSAGGDFAEDGPDKDWGISCNGGHEVE